MDKAMLTKWSRDVVGFTESLWIRRPDETTGPIKLSDRQKGVLRTAAATNWRGRPRYKTFAWIAPKRSGKSLLSAAFALWKSLSAGRLSVILSNSREQSEAIIADMVVEMLTTTPELSGIANIQRGRITFPWGSEIRVVPCNPKTVAGIKVSGCLVSDELWAADEGGEEAFHLLASQCEGAAAQVFLVSQASGHMSYLYELYQRSLTEKMPGIHVDYMSPDECQTSNPNPYLDEGFLESRRAALPKALFDKYHLNIWGEGGQGLFPVEQVEAVFDFSEAPRNKAQWDAVRAAWAEEGLQVSVGAGLDRSLPQVQRDDSVFSVVARVGKSGEAAQFYLLRQAILPTGHESEIMAEHRRCENIFGSFPTYLESYQSADLENRVPRSTLKHPTSQAQQELYNRVCSAMAQNRLHASADTPKLRNQLLSVEVDTTKALPKFGAPGVAADDCVLSLLWAMACADERPVSGGFTFYFDGDVPPPAPGQEGIHETPTPPKDRRPGADWEREAEKRFRQGQRLGGSAAEYTDWRGR